MRASTSGIPWSIAASLPQAKPPSACAQTHRYAGLVASRSRCNAAKAAPPSIAEAACAAPSIRVALQAPPPPVPPRRSARRCRGKRRAHPPATPATPARFPAARHPGWHSTGERGSPACSGVTMRSRDPAQSSSDHDVVFARPLSVRPSPGRERSRRRWFRVPSQRFRHGAGPGRVEYAGKLARDPAWIGQAAPTG